MNIMMRAFLLLSVLSTIGLAQSTSTPVICKEYIAAMTDVQEKLVSLLQATPEKKLSWRPAEGIRSTSEVFLHAAGGNYLFATFIGVPLPESAQSVMDRKTGETYTQKKDEITKQLNGSSDFLKEAIGKLRDNDLDKVIDFFGSQVTLRYALLVGINHLYEHLGQSIAYARSNGIVPPWSK